MGEPNSMEELDPMTTLALSALSPSDNVSASLLRKSGLHRTVLQSCYDAFKPEIKNLVGWKSLREFGYKGNWTDDIVSIEKAEELTATWRKVLQSQGLSDEMAVLVYDGEILPAPARDYRLFVLRDGRLLYYAGGFYATRLFRTISSPVCGDVLTVLTVLEDTYSSSSVTASEEPFVVLMRSFGKCLQDAIAERKRRIGDQEKLQAQIEQLVARVSNK